MDRQSNGKVTPTDRSIAVHEAAHAVAAVRLGLPLVYTSIRAGGAGDDAISADAQRTARPGGKLLAAGHTVLERGALAQWEAVLPDPQARANLEKVSVYTAAGIVAETKMGAALNDEGNRNDLTDLLRQAATLLGSTFSLADPPPAVLQWVTARLNDADALLRADDGAAWDRMMATLVHKKDLSGDEVLGLVAEADAVSSTKPRRL